MPAVHKQVKRHLIFF